MYAGELIIACFLRCHWRPDDAKAAFARRLRGERGGFSRGEQTLRALWMVSAVMRRRVPVETRVVDQQEGRRFQRKPRSALTVPRAVPHGPL